MTQLEIKEAMQKVLYDLKTLQSMGTYNRQQIDTLNARRKELQSLCTHENTYLLNVSDDEPVSICEDCQKILY
jgi:hypothetical protein